MKKRFLTLLFTAGATAAVLTACGTSESVTQTESITETATTQAETTTETASNTYTIGQVVSFTDSVESWDMTVDKITYQDSLKAVSSSSGSSIDMKPYETGKKFVVLYVTLKNTGKSTQYFDNIPSRRLVYNNDFDYSRFNTMEIMEDGTPDSDTDLIMVDPLSEKKGVVIFEVPVEVADSNNSLNFKGQYYGSETVFFDIKLR